MASDNESPKLVFASRDGELAPYAEMNCYSRMIKVDLKDAHFQIPIHLSHQCYLHFAWEGKYYKF